MWCRRPDSIVGEVICRGTRGARCGERRDTGPRRAAVRWPGLGHEPHALDQSVSAPTRSWTTRSANRWVRCSGTQRFLAERKRNGPGDRWGWPPPPCRRQRDNHGRGLGSTGGRAARPDVSVSKVRSARERARSGVVTLRTRDQPARVVARGEPLSTSAHDRKELAQACRAAVGLVPRRWRTRPPFTSTTCGSARRVDHGGGARGTPVNPSSTTSRSGSTPRRQSSSNISTGHVTASRRAISTCCLDHYPWIHKPARSAASVASSAR